MAIENKYRVMTEKTTSIEDPIELSQKGIIQFVPSKGNKILIPCLIPNPMILNIMPMTQLTRKALSGASNASAGGWSCDLTLHHATAASSAFGSIASTVLEADKNDRIRLSPTGILYQSKASMAANSCSNAALTNATNWKPLPQYGTNAKRYLVVDLHNSASLTFKAKKQKLAYEVRGY